jgi:hypothetical protein
VGAKALLYRGKKEICMSLSGFIKRNSKGLFLYKRFPEEEIEHTNNAAEIIFSLFQLPIQGDERVSNSRRSADAS